MRRIPMAAVVVGIIGVTKAAMNVNEDNIWPLKYGDYEMDDTSNLFDVKMETWQSKGHIKVVAFNITFENEKKESYSTGEMKLERTPTADGCYKVQKTNTGPKDLGSVAERLKGVSNIFPEVSVSTSSFRICPKDDDSLIVRLGNKDVRMVLTNPDNAKGEFMPTLKTRITPGHYTGDNIDNGQDLKCMEIDVSEGKPGMQKANMTFIHTNGSKYEMFNVPLKTYRRYHPDSVGSDDYYFTDSHQWKEWDVKFSEATKMFPEDLKRMKYTTSRIRVKSDESILFELLNTHHLKDGYRTLVRLTLRRPNRDGNTQIERKKTDMMNAEHVTKKRKLSEDEEEDTEGTNRKKTKPAGVARRKNYKPRSLTEIREGILKMSQQ